jgi:AP-5 complex subunit zeta-1
MSFLTFLYSPVLVLVVALEKVGRSSGSLIGSSIASIQKSAAPEVFLFFSFFFFFESLRNYTSLVKTFYGVAINDIEFMRKQMLLALMDEAYTGSTIGDGGADSESDDSNTMDAADPLFLELLKDENDGLAVSSFLMPQVPFCIF